MKKIILIAGIIFFATLRMLFADAVQEEWVRFHDGTSHNYDRSNAIALDSQGNIYVTGGTNSNSVCTTIKYDPQGNEIWVRDYTPGNGRYISIDGQNNIYIAGDSVILKYDSEGNELWAIPISYNAVAFVLDSEGNICATGGSKVAKYDPEGSELWIRLYDGETKAIALDKQNAIYVTGSGQGSTTGYDYLTAKYSSDGNEIWAVSYEGPFNDRAMDILVDNLGNVYISGYSSTEDSDFLNIVTIQYDSADGDELWTRTHDGPYDTDSFFWGLGLDIELDSQNNLYVGGAICHPESFNDWLIIKYNSSGDKLLSIGYEGPAPFYEDIKDLYIDEQDNIYVTGGDVDYGTIFDFATIKYNPEGIQQWIIHYARPTEDPLSEISQAMVVDSNGNVYVTGGSEDVFGDAGPEDYITIKYSVVIHVPEDYPTIQAAIDAAEDGNTILVAPGTYIENINFNGRNITLKSKNGAENTIIDGNRNGSVVIFSNNETKDAVIDGFTITNGAGTYLFEIEDYGGGGINCYSASPTIKNCIISRNSSGVGGGIYCQHSASPAITDCTISLNTVEWDGGGIGCYESSSPIITNCTITQNSADYGGGLYSYSSSPSIKICAISGNIANSGGGLRFYSSTPEVTGTAISKNSANYGGGLYYDSSRVWIVNCSVVNNIAHNNAGGLYSNYTVPLSSVENSIFWDNSAPHDPEIGIYGPVIPTVSYSDIKGSWVGDGNIDLDPLFTDPENNNFHLSLGSPCIDAGDPASDYSQEPEPNGNRIDMGAYGNTPEATASLGFQPNFNGQTIDITKLPVKLIRIEGEGLKREILSFNAISAGDEDVNVVVQNLPGWLKYHFTPGNPAQVTFYMDNTLKLSSYLPREEIDPAKTKGARVTIIASNPSIPDESLSIEVIFKESKKTEDSVIKKSDTIKRRP